MTGKTGPPLTRAVDMLQRPLSSLLPTSALGAALAALALCACGDDDTAKYDGTVATGLETAVTPAQVAAGERATVTCTRVNGHGEPLAGGQFVIGIDPTDASFVEGFEVFGNRAGTHHVTCSDTELGLIDKTPADLVIVAGPPVSTRIAIDPSTVEAGVVAAVSCEALDAHGNVAAANLRLETTRPDGVPPEAVTADGVTGISATALGSYDVVCFAAAVDEAARAHATLTVTPGPRVGIALRLDPEQAVYSTFQAVKLVGVAVDANGNERAGEVVPLTHITSTPSGHMSFTGTNQEKIRFDAEDRYVVSAEAADDATQTASVPFVVDVTKPSLTLTSPARGTVTDTKTKVTVAGTVSDNLGQIASLTIAGHEVAMPPAGGNFSVDIDLAYGLTLLDVHAKDTQGLETLVTRAVEQGLGGFRGMTGHTFEADGVQNAAVLVLTQDAFDDGDHAETARDDLASIVEYVVRNLDFVSFVPDPLTSFSCINGTCTLRLTSVTMDDVRVTMTLANGRIHMKVELIEFAGQMGLVFPCDTPVICTTRPFATIPATFKTHAVTLDTDIAVTVTDGHTQATAENTTVTMDGFDIEVSGDPTGLLQGALNGVVNLLRDIIIGAMEALLETLVQDQVTNALSGLFDALTIDKELDIPSPVGGAPNTLVIQTRAEGVDIAPQRLQLRVQGLAYAKSPARPHPHPGSLRHTGCAPEQALTFPPPSPITVGLHDDLVNELLYAIWDGGTVSLDIQGEAADKLLGQFGLTDATVHVDPTLPPVFETCAGEDAGGDKVQLGDLFVDIEATFAGDPIHLALWLLAEAPLGVDFVRDEAGALQAKLALDAIDPLWIEVVTNEGPFADQDETVVDLVKNTLIPQLLSTIGESATFTLPSIDLGALTTAVPAGTMIDLDIQSVARDNAYLTINASLK